MRKPIPNYEGRYEADSDGYIVSVLGESPKRIHHHADSYGYLRVRLYSGRAGKSALAHRLVAMVFIPNPGQLPEVNHINGNKSDNRVENLEWMTHKQNREHAKLLPSHCIGERNGAAKLNWSSVRSIKALHINGEKQKDIAVKFGINHRTVSEICRGNLWKRDPDNERCDQLAAQLVIQ